MEGISIHIDLVESALAHRQFLQLVDEHPSLYAGPHVQNAIRRYGRNCFNWDMFLLLFTFAILSL